MQAKMYERLLFTKEKAFKAKYER